MVIKVAKKHKSFRFGARKYARIISKTNSDKTYDVVKVRIKGTRNYKYMCTCPDFIFRQRACKHIKLFKEKERR